MEEQLKTYPISQETTDNINHRFSYHAPKPGQPARYEMLRSEAKRLAMNIVCHTPAGREQALALTKLEEAIFWTNAGIARGE